MQFVDNIRRFAAENRMALSDPQGTLTFQELDTRSDAIALWLSENLPEKKPVVLWGDKEHDMMCCLFGALKAGRPYVAIPSHYPEIRVAAILNNSGASAIFHIGEISMTVPHPQIFSTRDIDQWVRQYRGMTAPEAGFVQPEDICCIFYTSGSTGAPKGVQISRANLEAMCTWWAPIVDPHIPAQGGRALNFASYAFSFSMGMIFYCLATAGLTLHAVSQVMAMDYQTLFQYILQADPHYLPSTPSFSAVCLQDPRFDSQHLPSLRFMVLGGEVLTHGIGQQLLQRFPRTYVCSGYGATETTIGPISCRVTADMLASHKPIPIGYADPHSLAYIASPEGRPLPDGEVGELIVVSEMISLGYLNDPERTSKVFFVTPAGRRGYHTGDLMIRENELFYFIGRKDNQVKVGGYRVELEDVEKNLRQVSLVRNCAVVPVRRGGQVIMLAAFVVPRDPAAPKLKSIIAIKKELGALVQAYMIPQKIVLMADLPKNTSGKIDRVRLTEMAKLPAGED